MITKDIEERLYRIFKDADEQLSSGDLSFLYQVDLSSEDYVFLRTESERLMDGIQINHNYETEQKMRSRHLLLSLLMVDCAFIHYDESGYWTNLRDYLGLKDLKNETRIGLRNTFCRIVDFYDLSINTILDEESPLNINDILMQTFVPKNYLPSFFSYVYNLFDNVWDGCIPENIYGSFENIAYDFKDVDFDSGYLHDNATGSAKLIRSTRRVMRDSSAFGPIVEKILRRFESNNDFNTSTDLGRFEEDFNIWYDKNKEVIKRSKGQRRKNSKLYIDDNGQLRIRIPSQKVEHEKPVLEVLVDDSVVVNRTLGTYRQNSILRIEETDVGGPFDYFHSITVKIDGKLISPGIHIDRFVIFDSFKEQILSPSEGVMYIAAKNDILVSYNDVVCDPYDNVDGGNIYYINGKMGDTINIDSRRYFLGKVLVNHASIGSLETSVVHTLKGKSYPVTPSHPVIGLTLNDRAAKKSRINLICNEIERYVFYPGEYETFKNPDGSDDLLRIIDPNSKTNIPSEAGRYRLKIIINHREDTYDYFLLPGICPQYDKRTYHSETSGVLKLGGTYGEIRFDSPMDLLEWDQKIGEENMHFTSRIPYITYDFGWGQQSDPILKINDLGDNMLVDCPLLKNPVLMIYLDEKKIIKHSQKVRTFSYNISDIPKLIHESRPTACKLTISEEGYEEELFSIDVPTKVRVDSNIIKGEVTINVDHIECGSTVVLSIDSERREEK